MFGYNMGVFGGWWGPKPWIHRPGWRFWLCPVEWASVPGWQMTTRHSFPRLGPNSRVITDQCFAKCWATLSPNPVKAYPGWQSLSRVAKNGNSNNDSCLDRLSEHSLSAGLKHSHTTRRRHCQAAGPRPHQSTSNLSVHHLRFSSECRVSPLLLTKLYTSFFSPFHSLLPSLLSRSSQSTIKEYQAMSIAL